MKQQQLYETCQHFEEINELENIEALDETLITENVQNLPFVEDDDINDKVFSNVTTLVEEVPKRKVPRKQDIEILRKHKSQLSNEDICLTCNECGIALANNVSLKRHIDRVSFGILDT